MKPLSSRTDPCVFPAGETVYWEGDGPHEAAILSPAPDRVLAVVEGVGPITFEGSVDKVKFATVRDQHGDPVTLPGPGLYQLPFPLEVIRPVVPEGFTGSVTLFH